MTSESKAEEVCEWEALGSAVWNRTTADPQFEALNHVEALRLAAWLTTRDRAHHQQAQRLEQAVAALREVRERLDNVQENRCTCPHDYFHGDHHYQWCPGNDAAKKASSQLWISHNQLSYWLDKALASLRAEQP